MRKLVILGATGSIGKQALDVARGSEDLHVVGLAAAESWERLLAQAVEHSVHRRRPVGSPAAASAAEAWGGERSSPGPKAPMRLVVESGADMVLNGLVAPPASRRPSPRSARESTSRSPTRRASSWAVSS